jgi:hypothetical protein
MAVILANWEAEIGNMVVQGPFRQIVHETNEMSISKVTKAKYTGGMA